MDLFKSDCLENNSRIETSMKRRGSRVWGWCLVRESFFKGGFGVKVEVGGVMSGSHLIKHLLYADKLKSLKGSDSTQHVKPTFDFVLLVDPALHLHRRNTPLYSIMAESGKIIIIFLSVYLSVSKDGKPDLSGKNEQFGKRDFGSAWPQ